MLVLVLVFVIETAMFVPVKMNRAVKMRMHMRVVSLVVIHTQSTLMPARRIVLHPSREGTIHRLEGKRKIATGDYERR